MWRAAPCRCCTTSVNSLSVARGSGPCRTCTHTSPWPSATGVMSNVSSVGVPGSGTGTVTRSTWSPIMNPMRGTTCTIRSRSAFTSTAASPMRAPGTHCGERLTRERDEHARVAVDQHLVVDLRATVQRHLGRLLRRGVAVASRPARGLRRRGLGRCGLQARAPVPAAAHPAARRGRGLHQLGPPGAAATPAVARRQRHPRCPPAPTLRAVTPMGRPWCTTTVRAVIGLANSVMGRGVTTSVGDARGD
jgi:hypothetical protein